MGYATPETLNTVIIVEKRRCENCPQNHSKKRLFSNDQIIKLYKECIDVYSVNTSYQHWIEGEQREGFNRLYLLLNPIQFFVNRIFYY